MNSWNTIKSNSLALDKFIDEIHVEGFALKQIGSHGQQHQPITRQIHSSDSDVLSLVDPDGGFLPIFITRLSSRIYRMDHTTNSGTDSIYQVYIGAANVPAHTFKLVRI